MMPTFIKEILSIILAVRLFPFENLIKRQLKGHDIHQTSSRPDCTHFAKYRKRSIAYCRRYVTRECIYPGSGEAEAQEPGYSRQIGTKAMYTLRENSSVTPVLRWQDIYGQF